MEKFYQDIQVDEFYASEMNKCHNWLVSEQSRREIISEISTMVVENTKNS